jgi:hypothetical protein
MQARMALVLVVGMMLLTAGHQEVEDQASDSSDGISYKALRTGNRAPARADEYTRGCSHIFRCRGGRR